MEGEPQETALVAAGDELTEIEKRRAKDDSPVEHHDLAGLLDDEQPPRTITCMGDGHGTVQIAYYRLQLDSKTLAGGGAGDRRPHRRSKKNGCANDPSRPLRVCSTLHRLPHGE